MEGEGGARGGESVEGEDAVRRERGGGESMEGGDSDAARRERGGGKPVERNQDMASTRASLSRRYMLDVVCRRRRGRGG
jgi:hypothetical protein